MDKTPIGIERIRELLPHRYPMLMIDRVIELSEQHVLAEKLVSANEPVFTGHFPDRPIFPGVLILEAMAQAGGIWALNTMPQNRGLMTVLAGIDEVRFRRQVVPGDVLRLEVRPIRSRPRMTRFSGKATVDGELAAEAVLLAAFVNWQPEEEG